MAPFLVRPGPPSRVERQANLAGSPRLSRAPRGNDWVGVSYPAAMIGSTWLKPLGTLSRREDGWFTFELRRRRRTVRLAVGDGHCTMRDWIPVMTLNRTRHLSSVTVQPARI